MPEPFQPPSDGLEWREAQRRYAPHIVVCQQCGVIVEREIERTETLCAFHLAACGLAWRLEAAQYRLLTQLTRRIAHLCTSPLSDDLPS